MNRALMNFEQISGIADDNQRRIAVALRAANIGVFEYEPQNDTAFWDARIRELWGWTSDEEVTFGKATAQIHPEDRAYHDSNYDAVLDPDGSRHMDMEFRLLPRGGTEMRWIHAVAICSFEDDLPVRLTGTVQDVTERRMAEERAIILVHELEHRVKNTLNTVLSLINLSHRGRDDLDAYVEALNNRMFSMSQAHDAMRENDWRPMAFQKLVELQILDILGEEETRIIVSGPELTINPRHVLTVAMALHELFTNAMKYGALTQETGRIEVTCHDGDSCGFSWQEEPAGPFPENTRRAGFGSFLLQTILPRELNGSAEMENTADGLRYAITWPSPKG